MVDMPIRVSENIKIPGFRSVARQGNDKERQEEQNPADYPDTHGNTLSDESIICAKTKREETQIPIESSNLPARNLFHPRV